MGLVLIIIVILVLLFVLFMMESNREQKNFVKKEYTYIYPRHMKDAKAIKAVLLSDLHNHVYGKNNDSLLMAIAKEQPDLIFVAGDMLVGKSGVSTEVGTSFMERVAKIAPVYYANGNHEQRMKEEPDIYGDQTYQNYKDRILKAGVHVLENQTACIEVKETPLAITGLELPRDIYQKFRKTIVTDEQVLACVGQPQKGRLQILIAHNPVYFPAYKKWGADLTVSGHLHGGIIRLPGLGGLITPQAWLFPKYSGELTVEGEKGIMVSKGLGSHTINIRFLNSPELVVLHLKKGEDSE